MAIKFPDILEHNNSYRPLIDDGFIAGGAKSVADKVARNAIPIYKRKRGTLVSYLDGLSYVTQRYSLDDVSDPNWTNDGNWESLPFIDQSLNTTDSPTFVDLTLTGDITIGGTIVGSSFLESGDNISELINDSGYLTAVPSNYFDKTTDDSDDVTEGATNLFYTTARKDIAVTEYITIACSDEISDLEAGTGVVEFQMPFAMTLSEVRATVTTAPTGSNIEVDINEGGVSILSTVISIDASEKTSETATTPPVISDTSLADGGVITVDVDQVGSTIAGTGLKVQLKGVRT